MVAGDQSVALFNYVNELNGECEKLRKCLDRNPGGIYHDGAGGSSGTAESAGRTTAEGRAAVDAPCKGCGPCTREWCFSFVKSQEPGRSMLIIEGNGGCGQKSSSRTRVLERAKE